MHAAEHALTAMDARTPCSTYYSYRFNARAKGIGWRLDHFLVSQALASKVGESSSCHRGLQAATEMPMCCLMPVCRGLFCCQPGCANAGAELGTHPCVLWAPPLLSSAPSRRTTPSCSKTWRAPTTSRWASRCGS